MSLKERKDKVAETLIEVYHVTKNQATKMIKFGWQQASENLRDEYSEDYREACEDGMQAEWYLEESQVGFMADDIFGNYVNFQNHLKKIGKEFDEDFIL